MSTEEKHGLVMGRMKEEGGGEVKTNNNRYGGKGERKRKRFRERLSEYGTGGGVSENGPRWTDTGITGTGLGRKNGEHTGSGPVQLPVELTGVSMGLRGGV